MSHKSGKIAAMIEGFQGRGIDPHYLGFFHYFNRQLFYEAHDILEELWLPCRKESAGNFYKGLIQLAGAFVHLQKNRLRPAAALFKLAEANLHQYPPVHEDLRVTEVLGLIQGWLGRLEASGFEVNPLTPENIPRLDLIIS